MMMKEKIKIITDGETARVYIDGKHVRCTDMELHFSGHAGRNPMITVDARWHKEGEEGFPMLSEDQKELLTDGIKINC